MKKVFRSFYDHYDPEKLKEIWKKENTLFIFDTNTLLDLYSYRPKSQEEFFNYLSKVKDQTWLPFHVGLELHNNRIKVIKTNEAKHKKVDTLIEDICKLDLAKKDQLACNYVKDEYPEIYNILDKLTTQLPKKYIPIKELLDKAVKDIKKILEVPDNLKTNYFAHKDNILDRLNEIYSDDKVGCNTLTEQDQINALWEEAKKRWEAKIPPGYEDYREKKEKTFTYSNLKYYNALGDLIIFNEIKKYVTETPNIVNLVFISNDNKEDWKSFISHQEKVDLGARYELRNELFEASEHLDFFEIINSTQFLEISAEIHGNPLSAEIIQDIETAKNSYDDQKSCEIYNDSTISGIHHKLWDLFKETDVVNKKHKINHSIANYKNYISLDNQLFCKNEEKAQQYLSYKEEINKQKDYLETLNEKLNRVDIDNDEAEYLSLLAESMAIKNVIKKKQGVLKTLEESYPYFKLLLKFNDE